MHDEEGDGKVKRFLISFDPATLQTLDDLRNDSGRLSRSAMLAFLVAQEVRHRRTAPTPPPSPNNP